jgi:hypothetical protein
VSLTFFVISEISLKTTMVRHLIGIGGMILNRTTPCIYQDPARANQTNNHDRVELMLPLNNGLTRVNEFYRSLRLRCCN